MTFSPERTLIFDKNKKLDLKIDKIFSFNYSFNSSVLKINSKNQKPSSFAHKLYFCKKISEKTKKIKKKLEISKLNTNIYSYKNGR